LVVLPVATGVRQRFVDELSDKIAAPLSETLFGDHADFVDTIGKDPEACTVIEEELERILGVKLGAISGQGGAGAGVRRGTSSWYVSAYAAILWRIAMLAVWEERPIAINGALQGRDWVTVCVPRTAKAIAPSAMWRQSDSDMLLRVLDNQPPADFFIRQIKVESVRAREIAALNDKFMINTKATFKETEDGSITDNWHRIDGIGRRWVLLKPDTETGLAIISSRLGARVPMPSYSLNLLNGSPPTFDEYPAEWQSLLRIEKEANGIEALSAGADEFARASEASAAAVEAALDAGAH